MHSSVCAGPLQSVGLHSGTSRKSLPSMTHVHVQAVDGQPPAIVFYNEAADTVVFIKALDLTGSTWQTAAAALVIARGGGQYARWAQESSIHTLSLQSPLAEQTPQ